MAPGFVLYCIGSQFTSFTHTYSCSWKVKGVRQFFQSSVRFKEISAWRCKRTQSSKFKLLHHSQGFDILLKLPRSLNHLLSWIWSAAWRAFLCFTSEVCQLLFIDLDEVLQWKWNQRKQNKAQPLTVFSLLLPLSPGCQWMKESILYLFCLPHFIYQGCVNMHSTGNQPIAMQDF